MYRPERLKTKNIKIDLKFYIMANLTELVAITKLTQNLVQLTTKLK